MAKKERFLEYDWQKEDDILNYRPSIIYQEPEQEDYEYPEEKEIETIDSIKQKTQGIIDGLKAVVSLSNLAQERVDERVRNAGGVEIALDPQADAATIQALKRAFPDKDDYSKITFDDYRQCIEKMHTRNNGFAVTSEDIAAAKGDQFTTNFGGYENQSGENRPEISSLASSMKPMDTEVFQNAAVVGLFALMLPLIKQEDAKEIAKHLATAPHM